MRPRWLDQPGEFIRDLLANDRNEDSLAINAAVAALLAGEEPPGFHRRDYHRLHVGPYRVHCIADGNVLHVIRVDRVP